MSTLDYSVVIPAYNAGLYLREALESVLNQTVSPREIIVVDDGSTDSTCEVAESFGQSIQLLKQHNCGEGAARNRGLDHAQGEWIAFLDADDRWVPNKMEIQSQILMEHSATAIACHSNYRNFGVHDRLHDLSHIDPVERYSIPYIANHSPIMPSSLVVKSGLPLRFPEWAKASVDVIYCLGLVEYGTIHMASEPLMLYRRHHASMSTANDFFFKAHLTMFRWLEENHQKYSEEIIRQIQVGHFQRLISLAIQAKYQRDWTRFDEICAFLKAYQTHEEVNAFLRSRMLPRAVYHLVDLLRAISSFRTIIRT